MKSLIAVVAAAFGLAGCIAVPVGGYSEPAYGPGYYGPPPVSFSFGYSQHGHHGNGHRRHHRRY
jgi:hypothetical protein